MPKQYDIIESEKIDTLIDQNVSKLKSLLVGDRDFLNYLIDNIIYMKDVFFPHHLDDAILKYYSSIIEECRKKSISFPSEIKQIRDAVCVLGNLAKGMSTSIYEELYKRNPDYSSDEALFMGTVCRKKIYEAFSGNKDLYDLDHFIPEKFEITDEMIIAALGAEESEEW